MDSLPLSLVLALSAFLIRTRTQRTRIRSIQRSHAHVQLKMRNAPNDKSTRFVVELKNDLNIPMFGMCTVFSSLISTFAIRKHPIFADEILFELGSLSQHSLDWPTLNLPSFPILLLFFFSALTIHCALS